MIPQFFINKNILVGLILAGVTAYLYSYVSGLKRDIMSLEVKVTKLQKDVVFKTLEKERLETAIQKQNYLIENLRAKESKAKRELAKWNSLPPKVKYKVITKIREVKSDDCKDIKNVINAVRNIDYNSL